MKIADVRKNAFAMPLTDPSFPRGPNKLPVLEVISGTHILSDLTLGLGSVVFDCLSEAGK